MAILPGLCRIREPEIMDDPALDPGRHDQALRGLADLNRLSLAARSLWGPIASLGRERGLRRLRVLDVAAGGGDVPLALWQCAQRAGVELEIHGIDRSLRAVQFARSRAAAASAAMRFSVADAVRGDLPAGYDVVLTSLFLHHLSDEEAAGLLVRMAGAARHLVLASDLLRSARGLALAWLATRLFTTSDVVRTDASRSVRAAFTLNEIRALADRAGLCGARIVRRWPCRFLLTWVRP